MRAVIYARYSSENQREASIEDQVEVCRRYAERQGWTITQIYDDRASSGASRLSRPGFLKMLTDGEAGRFDVLVCEAIDRLGRKLSDVADVFDRLSFRKIAVHATAVGLLTHMHIGIMGTMAQMALADLREKTKRGQLGRARAGRIPGGLAYGYEVVAPAPGCRDGGERRIQPDEAETVRRIFRAYAAGQSPRHIAYELNAAGIPGPGGRTWGDTTLRGQPDRGTGLLNNTLYIGRLSWNRCSYVKNPSTGKRVARLNSLDQREEVEVPELRIIDQALWDTVQARRMALRFEIGKTVSGQALNAAHRRKFLLSGLLTCGCCGAAYTIMATDRYGCSQHRSKGTCANTTTIRRQRVEERVLSGLKDRMLAPELVAEFVRAFAEEMATAQREAAQASGRLRHELAELDRKLEGVLRAVENGSWSAALQERLKALETRKTKVLAELADAGTPAPVVQLHPNAAAIYRQKVADLERTLADPAISGEAAEALGSLIERVVLTPDPDFPDGLKAELHGDLAMILSLSGQVEATPKRRRSCGRASNEEPPGGGKPGGQLSVVAGARNHLDLLLTG